MQIRLSNWPMQWGSGIDVFESQHHPWCCPPRISLSGQVGSGAWQRSALGLSCLSWKAQQSSDRFKSTKVALLAYWVRDRLKELHWWIDGTAQKHPVKHTPQYSKGPTCKCVHLIGMRIVTGHCVRIRVHVCAFLLIISITIIISSLLSSSHHHRRFLTPAIWRRWVRRNAFHCPRFFLKSIAPLIVSPAAQVTLTLNLVHPFSDVLLCLCVFFFRILHVDCRASCGIQPTSFLSTGPNHRSLRWTTLSVRVFLDT